MTSYRELISNGKMEVHNEENESQLQEFIKFLKEYFEVEEKKAEVQRFAGEHPIVTVFLIVTIAMCAVPVIIFSLFVFFSIIFAILGFLFVEGAVLAVGTMILGGILFIVALLAVGVSTSLVLGYYSVMQMGDVVTSVQDRISALNIPALSFLSRNNNVGEEPVEE